MPMFLFIPPDNGDVPRVCKVITGQLSINDAMEAYETNYGFTRGLDAYTIIEVDTLEIRE